MTTLSYNEQLQVCHCWCGIAVAVPTNLHRRANEDDSVGIYCPLGHKFFYTETTQQKLEKAQEALRQEREYSRDIGRRLSAEERSHAATRGHLTRHRKRAQAGVCPCCNRTFQQLARHMANKHPDFVPEVVSA